MQHDEHDMQAPEGGNEEDPYPNLWRTWSPEENEKLAREYESGTDLETMAHIFGRPTGAVRSRLRKLGLLSKERQPGS